MAGESSGVVVVTGGTAGVGRAAVREFARAGYDVAVLARGRAGLDATEREIRDAGRRALAVPTDVAEFEAVDHAANRVIDELGQIDVWVNVAFVGSLSMSWDLSMAEHRRITEVTYYGQVHGTQAALKHMRARDRGVVVNVGSAMAHRSIPLQAAYCGAKHALKGYTESVMTELAHEGSSVALCMVQLPGLNTPQFLWNLNKMPENPLPVPPIFQPEIAARAIRFLAQHPRRNMWSGFSTAYTILGARLAPKLLDRYLARFGVSGQQTEQRTPRRSPNVFAPSDELDDAGARGPFSSQAWHRDPQTWLSTHRRALLSATASAATASAAVLLRRRRRRAAGGVASV